MQLLIRGFFVDATNITAGKEHVDFLQGPASRLWVEEVDDGDGCSTYDGEDDVIVETNIRDRYRGDFGDQKGREPFR